jgi:uncharacterized protein
MIEYIRRAVELPPPGEETFFLWGPRQTGKSTLLHTVYPEALWIDLLKSEEYRRFTERPETLREIIAYQNAGFAVIDEIQKVPALLDEIHWLYENKGVHFALCGSSARKVKRGSANLLGGRGIRYELFGFNSRELGEKFELERMLNNGYLPTIYFSDHPDKMLNAYVSQYLKEEIAAEGLVRKLPAYSRFLQMAALSDCELVNYSTIARDTGVSSETIRGYFEILEDTLLGSFLPSYRRRPKRRVITAPKFYFSDIGIVNFLARRGRIVQGSELFGKAFENLLFHELRTYNMYKEKYAELYFWRLSSGIEVDFIINHVDCAIECKGSNKINSSHLKGLRHFSAEYPDVGRKMIVSLDETNRKTDDGIEVIHFKDFIGQLWKGEIF